MLLTLFCDSLLDPDPDPLDVGGSVVVAAAAELEDAAGGGWLTESRSQGTMH
jgi:hypothetical protein